MPDKSYVYALLCPLEGNVRYVGRSHDPAKRYKQHIALADLPKDKPLSARHRWIRELRDRDLEPELAILEVLERGEGERRYQHDRRVEDAERYWIARLASKGHPLTNANGYGKTENGRLMAEAMERGRKLAEALDVEPRMLMKGED